MNDPTMTAAHRLAAVMPRWTAVVPAGEALGLGRRVLLHAGPSFAGPAAACPPILNAAAAALVFEGEAGDFDTALALVHDGAVELRPAQDAGVVTPLASVVSRSTWLQVVEDAAGDGPLAFAPLNEGGGPALRFGLAGPAVVERLRLLRDTVGPALAAALTDPVDLLPFARHGLAHGDDLHGRPHAATARLTADLAPRLPGAAADFLRTADQFFLNLWMAACKRMMLAADGVPGAALVTAAGGNGIDMGIRLSGTPAGRWFTAPAEAPRGGPDIGPPRPRLPAIGDSAVIDAAGFGALAFDAAPDLRRDLGAEDLGVAAMQDRLLLVMHPALGRRVGLDAAAVVRSGLPPPVCLGALDAAGEAGLVGRGIARHPLACHAAAVAALG
ncbi:DUF1116 domain-containing protein [Azospirillum halopraeferens]|uniref:DUF1116 domain-containing protein n=1 Tax=Azospirillum halopraeferens TaxID=34010 RepID=UPI0003F8A96A|nr:DUF1116 domain-containing protein [Azospirillum halopraeferens]